MERPNNYENVQAGGDYTPIEVGGHHAVIMSVKEKLSSTGKNMVVVALDFAKNDKQPGYFKDQFDKDTRSDKKWPYQAVQYIVTEDNTGNCSRSFKGFITSFERSNNCKATWGEKFVNQFKNKKIGVVYGEVEEEYNGEVKTRRRIRWFCEDGKVDSQNIPDKKYYVQPNGGNSTITGGEDFMNVSDSTEDEIPFD